MCILREKKMNGHFMLQNKIIKIYFKIRIRITYICRSQYTFKILFYFLIPSACCFLEDSEMIESLPCTFTRG